MPIRPEKHNHAERPCAWCGDRFIPYHLTNDRFCSTICRKRSGRSATRTPKACPSCGNSFTPAKSKKQIYCSSSCKTAAQLRRVSADPARLAQRREAQKAYTKTEPYRAAQRKLKQGRREAIRAGDFTPEDWQAILERFGNRCAYCGTQAEDLTTDHVVPLSKGGTHTAENVVPACMPCNSAKGNRNWSDRVRCP